MMMIAMIVVSDDSCDDDDVIRRDNVIDGDDDMTYIPLHKSSNEHFTYAVMGFWLRRCDRSCLEKLLPPPPPPNISFRKSAKEPGG